MWESTPRHWQEAPCDRHLEMTWRGERRAIPPSGVEVSIALSTWSLSAFRPRFVFTPCIEELNIHATVKWTGLNALRKLLQLDAEKQMPETLAENLDQIDLTITVTRFGTIIYRISTS